MDSACNITQRAENGLLKPDDVTRASAGGDITDEFVGERAPNWFLALIWNGYESFIPDLDSFETLTPDTRFQLQGYPWSAETHVHVPMTYGKACPVQRKEH